MNHFSIRLSPADKKELIISVSKKVSKKAVDRNKIKRRVRAVMRSLLPKLNMGKYLIIAKPNALEIKGGELENELKTLLVVNRKL